MEKFLKFLKSNEAVLFAAIASLSTQVWHSVTAFVVLDVGGTENKWNYLFGILFSLSTSFAILLFTVRGKRNLAYFFLVVEIFINVIHYGLMNMNYGPLLYSTLFMCIIVPVTISLYSSEIDDKPATPEVKLQEPLITQPINDFEFIKEVNSIIGFDITDPNDKSSQIDEDKKKELRKLWSNRKLMSHYEIKKRMKDILKEDGSPLFKNL